MTWGWYRVYRGRAGWTMAHLFILLTLDVPALEAPTARCGYSPAGSAYFWPDRRRVVYAPALPEDPRCTRCERLEAM